jgi:hypothetical protein
MPPIASMRSIFGSAMLPQCEGEGLRLPQPGKAARRCERSILPCPDTPVNQSLKRREFVESSRLEYPAVDGARPAAPSAPGVGGAARPNA